tara:strand:+ start:2161 stop:2829 length:669 start_codon:yes stop_codon:yes gene_type:complete
MADLYPSNDGVVYKFTADTWANIRNTTSGSVVTTNTYYIQNSHSTGRGSDVYQIGRYFIEFDTSGITSTLDSATLKIYGHASGTLDVILLKSSQTGSVVAGDFNEITNASTPLGNSDGSGGGTFASTSVVEYSSEISTWSTSGYNDISLNSDALSDMVNNDTFNCVLISYDYDYLDQAVSGASYRAGFYTDANTGTSKDPYIDYAVASTAVTENATFFGANF